MSSWIKIISLVNSNENLEQIEKQIEIQKKASLFDIAPKIVDTWKTNEYYYIEMEYINENNLASKYGKNSEDISETIWNQIRNITQKLLNEKIEYIEVTPYNLLENNDKIYLINFKNANFLNEIKTNNSFLNKLLDKDNPENFYNPDFL